MPHTHTRAFLADGLSKERSALRLVLQSLSIQVVGEAADWPTTLEEAPATNLNMLVIDWGLLPDDAGTALATLRKACKNTIIVVLVSHLDSRQQAAVSAGADVFISKSDSPDRVAARLRSVSEFVGTEHVL